MKFIGFVIGCLIASFGFAKSKLPFENSHFIYLGEDKIKIHYLQFTPQIKSPRGYVMLVHGFAGSVYSWLKVGKQLSDSGYVVLAADVPGFGYSDKRRSVLSTEANRSRWFWELMDSVAKSSKWTLVGHSMGAGIVGRMAADHPERVQKLCWVDGYYSKDFGRESSRLMKSVFGSTLFLQIADVAWRPIMRNKRTFRKLLRSAYSSEPKIEDVQGYLQPFKLKNSAACILKMSTLKQESFKELPPNPEFKIVAIWGSLDAWIPLNGASGKVTTLTGRPIIIADGGGHCPMETHPDQVVRMIVD